MGWKRKELSIKKEVGTEVFNSENKKEFTKIALKNFCKFQLISEGVAFAPTVYLDSLRLRCDS
ncbi:hypothetical protein BCR21_10380 [Enterococcus ureasiticus]|uniref:Uncharacterized protein n=1 Tax=Enterococcus ureasiticus TaxID=903984 RepID=A0A1E5GG36_9ENTE|nr:hypothetical protein BCR21_10380 [Enterococcus ureasiticus]